jgi:transcriptional regulator with XRE-family HTH domain
MTIINSGVAMVRISGEKLRFLREQQELTQLYVATAVEVTTETISRWERAGTPNIKKENGQKLAMALQVELDDLLADVVPVPDEKQKERPPVKQNLKKSKVPLFLVLSIGVASAFFFFFRPHPSEQNANLYSLRTMPSHAVPGQIFPVRIQIGKPGDESASYLVKESVPEGCEVVAVFPKATVQNGQLLKWINREGGSSYFTYAARIMGGEQRKVRFSGTLKVGQSTTGEIPIQGNDSIQLLTYHWADRDKDNSISDEEMLAVYDDFPGMENLPVDIELVEDMWMGTKYIWNPDKNKFVISP